MSRLCWAVGFLAAAAPLHGARGDAQTDYARAVRYDLAGDEAKAFDLYLKAAQGGLPDAQLNVGLMYDSGRGTARDSAAAALYYAFAASNGNARAAYNLGLLYASGAGVPRNPQLAESWAQEATRLGLPVGNASAASTSPALNVTSVSAAIASYPVTDAVVQGGRRNVALVWTSAAEPAGTYFYLQLVAVNGPHTTPVLTEVTNLSTLRAAIGHYRGQYAWRVFTFCQSRGSYAATPWTRFSVD